MRVLLKIMELLFPEILNGEINNPEEEFDKLDTISN